MSVPRASMSAGLAGTTLAHGALVAALMWAMHRPASRPAIVYQIDLVAAPLPSATAPRGAAPTAEPVKKEETVPTLKPKNVKKPPPTKAPESAKPVEDVPITKPATTPLPTATPSTGQDQLTMVQKGIVFEYPAYLQNIVRKVYEKWAGWLGSSALNAEFNFTILRDGSIKDLGVSRSSGNTTFDRLARGAVEAAGNLKAFGPLPAGFNGDELPIAFYFRAKQ